jgi:hypothetical protein
MEREYTLVLEVARHGARAPSVIYDLALDSAENFQEPLELTQLGADQHYDNGEFVRERYFEGKAPTKEERDRLVYT